MKTYKIKSSANRAAKAEFGDHWIEIAEVIENSDGTFSYDLKAKTPPTPTLPAFLAQIDADVKEKAAKKSKLMASKPIHTPVTPVTIIVAEKMEANPTPTLPAFLKIASPADSAVPETESTDEERMVGMIVEANGTITQGDKQADLLIANTDPLRPRMSSIKLPTKAVWHIADSMPDAKRKAVIEECVRQGIAYGTARTQYQHWFKCINDCKKAVVATIGSDGKITRPLPKV